MTETEAIAELENARRIHEEWAAYLRGKPSKANEPDMRPLGDVVGGAEWHEHWIDVYDKTLEMLKL